MRILIAPDKFKNSLTSFEACQAIELGIRKSIPNAECISFPLADGGDGTSDILIHHTQGKRVTLKVSDPLFRSIETSYGISRDGLTAFIDMANASGLRLLKPEERDVMITTTFGTGELIKDALDRGVKNIILGIGGSSTNDGGIGVAKVLGFEFLDKVGQPVKPIGKELIRIVSIHSHRVHPRLKEVMFTAICDVDNPLTGEYGAAHVYAPQKGATPAQVKELDAGLKNFARAIREHLAIDIEHSSGAGAGGGLGGGAIAFFNTTLKRGVDLVFEFTSFEDQVKRADFIITGEGKVDQQTLYGKLITGITGLAAKYGKKVIGITGKNELNLQDTARTGLDHVVALTDYVSEEEAMKNAFEVMQNVVAKKLPGLVKKVRE